MKLGIVGLVLGLSLLSGCCHFGKKCSGECEMKKEQAAACSCGKAECAKDGKCGCGDACSIKK